MQTFTRTSVDRLHQDRELLQTCVRRIGSRLCQTEERALRAWGAETHRSSALAAQLFARAESEWSTAIVEHRAHRHVWYDQLAEEVSAGEFAAFLFENWALPPFLPLVERAFEAQICDEGRAALLRNISDEQFPVPHSQLMRHLVTAVKTKVGDDVRYELYPSLINRTLVFYYGYYCDPWHLIGSLYATELMGQYRMIKMGVGLERLGFSPADLEFIRVHISCDEDHAQEWGDSVIVPSIQLNPALRIPIAEGIAACLETSARYLDDLSERAFDRSANRTHLALARYLEQ